MFRAAAERQFKRADGGWTYIASYPHYFFRFSTYLVTDAQRADLIERLVRAYWLGFGYAIGIALALASALVAIALGPDLDERWVPVIMGLFFAALFGLGIPPLLILIYRAVRPVLSHAKRVGPATYAQAMQRAKE